MSARRWLCLALVLAPAIGAQPNSGWRDGFDEGRLDTSRWSTTVAGDFKEHTVDVVDVGDEGVPDYRLRLRADTRGTRDDTVKFLGVRTVERILVRDGARIGVTLDWNAQANGSYLSAAVILTPRATSGNPLENPDWLRVEYVGVPPGRNARLAVSASVGGQERTLFDEGWPEANRAGRKIGLQKLLLTFEGSVLELRENDRQVLESALPGLDASYLHLQLSSHSNYPPREVLFDDVAVTAPRR